MLRSPAVDGMADGGGGRGSAPGPVRRITEALEKSSLDDRLYRVIRLPNELEALLVHDANTDKASASLDVGVGNFCDEDDMAGMAHAVEHVSPASDADPCSFPSRPSRAVR